MAFRTAKQNERAHLFELLKKEGRLLLAQPQSFYDENPHFVQVWERDYQAGFAFLGFWRMRLGIGAIHYLAPPLGKKRVLLDHVVQVMAEAGVRSIVSPMALSYEVSFYKRAGFVPCEKLLLYEKISRRQLLGFNKRRDEQVASRKDSVRLYEDRDFEAIVRLDQQAFAPFWAFGEEELKPLMEDAVCFVAESRGQVAGYVLGACHGRWGSILRLAVNPEYQGQGLGTDLLGAAVNWFREHRVKEIGLSTQADNERSQRLYARFGFHPLPDKRHFLLYGGKRPDLC